MSAAELREAAALMRSRAERATPGPWFADDLYATVTAAPYRSARAAYDRRPSDERVWVVPESMDSSVDGDDLAHIAGMSPLVALAVADWLEAVGERHVPMGHPMYGVLCCSTCNLDLEDDERGHCDDLEDALTVARTYLGGVS